MKGQFDGRRRLLGRVAVQEGVQGRDVEVEGLRFQFGSGFVFEQGAEFAADQVVGVREGGGDEGAGFGEAERESAAEEGVVDFVAEFAGEGLEVVHFLDCWML